MSWKEKVFATLIFIFVATAGLAQKGAKSISVGPVISFPLPDYGYESYYNPGGGAEIMGQWNFTNRSALLLQTSLASWGAKDRSYGYQADQLTLLSLKAGYRYQFPSHGIFLHGLAGTDIEIEDAFTSLSVTVGAGKRFIIRDIYFIDAGIDIIDGDTEPRIQLKALFSIFRWPKTK